MKRLALLLSLISAVSLAEPVGAGGVMESQARNAPVPIEKLIGLEQKVGADIPQELTFTDEKGATVALSSFFGKGPVILTPVYYECPSLCGMVMSGVFRGLSDVKLEPGRQFNVVFFSIDPRETPELAAKKKANYIKNYIHSASEQGIHFLVGNQETITRLTNAIGFKYTYDEKTKQYAHPGVAVVITAEGKISRYHLGVEFPRRDLRLSLVNASDNKLGTVVDQFLLYCYHYDPAAGRYGLAIMNLMRLLGVLTVLGTAILVATLLLRERRRLAAGKGLT